MRFFNATILLLGMALLVSSYSRAQWQLIETPGYNNPGGCSFYYNSAMASNFRIYWAYSATCPAGSFGQYCEYEIFATADLGASWFSKVYETDIQVGIQDMDFISGDTGYFVHYLDGFHSQLYRTSDYLTNKELVFCPETYDYRDLHMISYDDIYMIDNEARVFHVENDTFQLVYDLPLDLGGNMEGPDMAATVNHNLYIACESFLNGTYANDLILYSHNGGASWDTSFLSSSVHLNEIVFATDSLGIAVGDNGIILRTQDAALTWSGMPSGVDNDLFSLDYMNAQTWLAGGSDGMLLISEDAGESWEPLYSPTAGNIKQVKFPEKDNIIMIKSGSLWRANLSTITGISRVENPSALFTLSPNPANNQTVLTLNPGSGMQGQILLLNVVGDVVDEFEINKRETIIHLESYPSGIYFVMIRSDERRQLKKLIIR